MSLTSWLSYLHPLSRVQSESQYRKMGRGASRVTWEPEYLLSCSASPALEHGQLSRHRQDEGRGYSLSFRLFGGLARLSFFNGSEGFLVPDGPLIRFASRLKGNPPE